jgi:hypothetical protein
MCHKYATFKRGLLRISTSINHHVFFFFRQRNNHHSNLPFLINKVMQRHDPNENYKVSISPLNHDDVCTFKCDTNTTYCDMSKISTCAQISSLKASKNGNADIPEYAGWIPQSNYIPLQQQHHCVDNQIKELAISCHRRTIMVLPLNLMI